MNSLSPAAVRSVSERQHRRRLPNELLMEVAKCVPLIRASDKRFLTLLKAQAEFGVFGLYLVRTQTKFWKLLVGERGLGEGSEPF